MLITFDLDGVLQQNPFGRGVFPEVTAEIGEILAVQAGLSSAKAAAAVMKMIREEALQRLLNGDYVGAYDWDDIINDVAKHVGSPQHFDVEKLVVKYCTPDYVWAYPHAARVLAELFNTGIRLAVVTNGFYKYQNPVMEAIGLRQYFKKFITPEMVGIVKPFPVIYHAAFQDDDHFRLHVGDMIIHDVWGAAEAGLQPVWMVEETALEHKVKSLAPWERPYDESIKALVELAVSNDPGVVAYPDVKVDDCTPYCIICDLREVLDIVEYISRS
ncbi:MAG: HAD family hydrolase [Firmicutes bacterium]|nr:HAD family hydrolase [Bacillota bacterium]